MEHTSPSSSAHSAASQRFRRELRDCRVQRGLTQRALADLVRFSRETVAAVESGRRFGSHEFALRCDDVLGTGGRLAALWPQVAAEQLAADGFGNLEEWDAVEAPARRNRLDWIGRCRVSVDGVTRATRAPWWTRSTSCVS